MRHHRGSSGDFSGANLFGGVIVVAFGVLWTIMAFVITANSPFPFVHVVFPLFGLLFVSAGVVSLAAGTQAANRVSGSGRSAGTSGASRYCGRCGSPQEAADQFCSTCGTRASA